MTSPDVLIVGAGVFGLSVAFAAHRAGLSVLVLEDPDAQGMASRGIVGALTPHAPSRWRPMMAFQFRALLSLPDRASTLQELTGIDSGYARLGRITPLVDARARERAERDIAAAPGVWGDNARLSLADDWASHGHPGWVSPDAAPNGVLMDDLSARVSPRAYLSALRAALPEGAIQQNPARRLTADGVETATRTLSAGNVVLAGGWKGWDLVPGSLKGSGVKGQAALLKLDHAAPPLLYDHGLYIVPHVGGTVAVGSTSEKVFDAPDDTDAQLDDLIQRASSVCPALADAPVIERWAGVRPKPPGREPVIGPIPSTRHWMATGGFKIGFGIAHLAGDILVEIIRQEQPSTPLPETFLPVSHLAN